MFRLFFATLFIISGNALFAQYVHYPDNSNKKNTDAPPPAPVKEEKVVYHDWPDRCPALSGSIPVLTNYVPKELIPKLTEFFKGHLYSITSIKVAENKMQYKLKVCENGEIKIEYADESGDLIKK
jgi:hypothetical protein